MELTFSVCPHCEGKKGQQITKGELLEIYEKAGDHEPHFAEEDGFWKCPTCQGTGIVQIDLCGNCRNTIFLSFESGVEYPMWDHYDNTDYESPRCLGFNATPLKRMDFTNVPKE